MQIKPGRLRQFRLAAAAPASLDVPVGVDGDLTRVETIVNDAALAVMQSVGESCGLPATVSAAIEELPEREREVLRWRCGLASADTGSLVEIGNRLGVTRERARQIEKRGVAPPAQEYWTATRDVGARQCILRRSASVAPHASS
jgi:DNA-directed RNA polymerase sigma subunit (sigma70/sigma32)